MNLSERLYFYMPDNQAEDQTNRGKYNCSESMLRAINDNYQLELSEDALIQMAAFGGGLFMGDACGFLIGGYAALASMYSSEEAPRANDHLKTVCREWYTRFNNEFDTVQCNDMKPAVGGCSGHGKNAAKIFEGLISDVAQLK